MTPAMAWFWGDECRAGPGRGSGGGKCARRARDCQKILPAPCARQARGRMSSQAPDDGPRARRWVCRERERGAGAGTRKRRCATGCWEVLPLRRPLGCLHRHTHPPPLLHNTLNALLPSLPSLLAPCAPSCAVARAGGSGSRTATTRTSSRRHTARRAAVSRSPGQCCSWPTAGWMQRPAPTMPRGYARPRPRPRPQRCASRQSQSQNQHPPVDLRRRRLDPRPDQSPFPRHLRRPLPRQWQEASTFSHRPSVPRQVGRALSLILAFPSLNASLASFPLPPV